jgi:hypothetical protein
MRRERWSLSNESLHLWCWPYSSRQCRVVDAQMAKGGTFTSQFGWYANGKTYEAEKDHFLFVGDFSGTNFNDAGRGFLHFASIVCPGINDRRQRDAGRSRLLHHDRCRRRPSLRGVEVSGRATLPGRVPLDRWDGQVRRHLWRQLVSCGLSRADALRVFRLEGRVAVTVMFRRQTRLERRGPACP